MQTRFDFEERSIVVTYRSVHTVQHVGKEPVAKDQFFFRYWEEETSQLRV